MEKWIQFLRKNILYTVLGIVVIVLFFVSVRLLIGRVTGLPELIATVQTRRDQTDVLRDKFALLQSAQATDVYVLLRDTTIALPQDKDAGGILVAFEALTQQNDIDITSLNLTPGLVSTGSAQFVQDTVEVAQGVEGLRFTVETHGPLENTQSFLRAIYTVRRIFGIESVDLLFDDEGFVRTNLSLLAYISPDQEIKPLVESPIPEITAHENNVFSEVQTYPHLSLISASDDNGSNESRFDYFNSTTPTPLPFVPESTQSAVQE